MTAQHGRRVEFRVERHRHEAHIPKGRRPLNRFLDGNEMPIHQRAEIGQRTAGVDEGHRDAMAAEARKASWLCALIDQGGVSYGFASGEDVRRLRNR